MLHLPSRRTIAARVALLVSIASSAVAVGQQPCSVQETQRFATVTGRFLISSSSVSLTLPYVLYRSNPSLVYMQVSGSDLPNGLLLESGGERVRIEDGAALRLSPERNKRLTFAVVDRSGQHLCEWVTKVGTSKSNPPAIPEGFSSRAAMSVRSRGFKLQGFQTAGDPILLQVGGNLARESGEFSIDGAPMTVLARNACQVVLLDPHPAAGLRTIESRGYSISLPFVFLRLDFNAARATLKITVLGRDRIPLPELSSHRVSLYNYSPAGLELSCSGPLGHGDPTMVSLARTGAELSASCRVRILKPGPINIDGLFTEFSGPPRIPLLAPTPPKIPLVSAHLN